MSDPAAAAAPPALAAASTDAEGGATVVAPPRARAPRVRKPASEASVAPAVEKKKSRFRGAPLEGQFKDVVFHAKRRSKGPNGEQIIKEVDVKFRRPVRERARDVRARAKEAGAHSA